MDHIFQSLFMSFTMLTSDTETTVTSKSKRLSYESIRSPFTSDNGRAAKLKWILNSKISLEFKGRW